MQIGKHTVYVRARWADPWVEIADLHCEEAVWTAAPSIPTATFKWHYGWICPTGSLGFGEVLKLGLHRYYVRVVCEMQLTPAGEFATLDWYGVIEVTEDKHDGEASGPAGIVATGEQTITAYGMEHLLDREPIRGAWFDADDAGDIRFAERPLTFNRGGEPNRSASDDGDGVYVFSGFATAGHWTTRKIIQHLLAYQAPRNAAGVRKIPFALNLTLMADAAPDWDRPELPTEGRTVYSLLTSLLPRQRLTSFYTDVDDAGIVNIIPFTYVDFPVNTKGGAASIPKNPRQKWLKFGKDQSAQGTVKTSTLDFYDQVIARGARRRTVFTVSDADGTIEQGWSADKQATYEEGASTAAGYEALDLDTKRRRNAEARAVESLAAVFRRFVLPDDWDGQAADGFLGPLHPVFVDPNPTGGDPIEVEFVLAELSLDRSLPLIEGVDYSGSKIADGDVAENEGAGVESAPMCHWKLPGQLRYVRVERLACAAPHVDDAEMFDWSASVEIPPESLTLELIVDGAPQHVLDFPGFVGLVADEGVGEHNWRQAIFTVAIEENRRVEARFPADANLPAASDYVRRLVIDAGDSYRLDYVAPGTVVSVDADGALVRSEGGFLHDDREELVAAAKVAYAFYSRERRVLFASTEQLTTNVFVGDLIVAVGEEGGHFIKIRTPITEMRVSYEYGTTQSMPGPPRMRIVTDGGQFDALGLFDAATPEPTPADPARPLSDPGFARDPGPLGDFRGAVP